ncbi:MAG: hypothetical protein WBH44_03755 [Proteocatella sp.]
MLRKLLKYEFKGNGKIMLPFYGLILVLAVMTKLFNGINIQQFSTLGEIAFGVVAFSYGLTMASVMILTAFLIIQRFAKTVYGDEGYLTHTLPVKSRDIIISKTIAAIGWMALSGIVAMISVAIMAYYPKFFEDFAVAYKYFIAELGPIELKQIFIMLGYIITVSILATISGIMMVYMSISIGQLFKKKLMGSIAAFLGVSFISSIIVGFIGNSPIADMMEAMMNNGPEGIIAGINTLMLFLAALYIIKIAIYYFVTNHLMTKKLNLE